MQSNPSQPVVPRSLQFALFLTGLLWSIAARVASVRAARGLSQAAHLADLQSLFREAAYLFLLLAGFSALSWIATRFGDMRGVNALPKRSTAGQEWRQGAALGWGLLLLAVLPMVIFGDLHPEFSLTGRDFVLLLLSVAVLLVQSLAVEVAYRGFLFRQLIGATNEGVAAVVLSGIFALASSFGSFGTYAGPRSVQVTFCAGLLFSLAFLRTHGLWLGWGLRFGWSVTMAVLFGLPLSGSTESSSVVSTNALGPGWLTGGNYGPDGSLWTVVMLAAGAAVLYAMTRDYAWNYTYEPTVAGGYAVVVAAPAAHTAMEAAAAKPALVQIAAITPTAVSTLPQAEAAIRARETGERLEDL